MARRKNPVYSKLKRALTLLVSKKPITQKLLLFKRAKKYKLFKYYNYKYIGEYEFSPSNSPLIFRHDFSSKKRRNLILSLLCGGGTNLDFSEFEALPMSKETEEVEFVEFLPISNDNEEIKEVVEELEDNGEENGGGEDNESVDGRAERFIEKFYEEIRLQRQDSLVQWKEMLQRSC